MAKVYKSKASLTRAIKREGLQYVPHAYVETHEGWRAHFRCELSEDVSEIRARGFDASLHD